MFSVVIPSYNHRRYLVQGVVSALHSPLVSEILLVDDGSDDGSDELIETLEKADPRRVKRLPESGAANIGAARRLDQLVSAASCEWVAVLNSDDALAAGRFETLRRWCRDPVRFVCGSLVVIDEAGRALGTKKGVLEPEYPFPSALDPIDLAHRCELVPLLVNQNFVATTSNMVFTRSLYAEIGGFRDLRYVHDWDFALRAAALGGVRVLPHFLSLYRIHAANTIKEARSGVADEVRALLRDFLADFPHWLGDSRVVAGLRGNRYLDAAWWAEHAPRSAVPDPARTGAHAMPACD